MSAGPKLSLFLPFLKDIGCASKRHFLQILCRAPYTHYLLLRYRELGGMAILSQFVIERKNKLSLFTSRLMHDIIDCMNRKLHR